jgi:hypothetical protein
MGNRPVLMPDSPPVCLFLSSCLTCCVRVLAGQQVNLAPASSSNPGIPPSSLMSFLRVNASIAGLVLTEFDSSIQDPLYASRFDRGGRVNATAIAGVAAAVAAGLLRVAGGDPAGLKVSEAPAHVPAPCILGATQRKKQSCG